MSVNPSPDVPSRLTPSQFFQFTALLALLSLLSGADLIFRGLNRSPVPAQSPVWPETGKPERGAAAIAERGCTGCHRIPGIRTATGRVGPDLAGLRDRTFLAGKLPNTPANLVAWIQYPQEFAPETAMPNLEVTDAEAHDIAAYLYSTP